MLLAVKTGDGPTPRTIVPADQLPPVASLSVNTARDMAPAPSVASDELSRIARRARRRLVRRVAAWSSSAGVSIGGATPRGDVNGARGPSPTTSGSGLTVRPRRRPARVTRWGSVSGCITPRLRQTDYRTGDPPVGVPSFAAR